MFKPWLTVHCIQLHQRHRDGRPPIEVLNLKAALEGDGHRLLVRSYLIFVAMPACLGLVGKVKSRVTRWLRTLN